jgi:hypothetical protein
VADKSIFGDREAEFLTELVRQKVAFMIVGLSAAALQGAPVVTQDVELWFRNLSDPGIEKALRKVHGSYVPPIMQNPPMFAGAAVNLFDIVTTMDGLEDFDRERGNTIKLRLGRVKVPVLKLERIIASKKAAGREKDKRVLKVLQDALKAIQERERSNDRTSG